MTAAPAHWAATDLAEITRSIANHRPDDRPEEDFVYIDISSIDDVNRITEPKQLSGRDAPSRARQLVEAGDTVLSTVRTYLKNTALVPDSLLGAIASTGFCVLRPAAGVHPQFIFYRVLDQTFVDELSGLQAGTSYPAVRDSDVRAMSISLPPTAEQHRIVQTLDSYFTRLDAARAALERVQANLKRYRASVLKAAVEGRLVLTEAELARKEGRDYEPADQLLERILSERRVYWESHVIRRGMYKEPGPLDTTDLPEVPVGWVWSTLNQITHLKGGVTKGQRYRGNQVLGEVPYLRVANVQRGFLDLGEVKSIRVPEKTIEELRLMKGDVLFTEGGDRDKLGRGWVWHNELPNCIHQNHVFRSRLYLSDIAPEFVSWWGNSFGQEFFTQHGKQTTNLASINLTLLSTFPVPLPPLAEQRRIVAEVERRLSVIQQAEATVEANLVRAEGLRQSILTQAFCGKLVPQDPSDEPATVLLERIRLEREASHADAKASRQPRPRRTKPISARQLVLREGNP